MGGVIANYHHFYTFIFVVSNLILYALSINDNTLSSTESLTVSGNRTIVSPGDDFELGFFKPPSGSGWYLGIWYKKIPVRTYVWVANRDNPLSNSIGTLKTNNSNLVLHDHAGSLVWSTNLTKGDGNSQVVAELLANGNFVLRYSTNNDSGAFLWQSFDFPTDTLLPQMKLGWDVRTGRNRFLRSWRSQDDPSSGDYFYKLETQGLPEFFLWVIDARVHRSGPWDGIRFSSMPEAAQSRYMVYNFTYNLEEVAYTFQMTDHKVYSRLTMTSSGFLQRLTWTPTIWGWNQVWSLPTEQCEMYQKCGPYAYCDSNTSPLCNCIRGFDPKNQQEWDLSDGSTGCVRRTRLSCNGDGFHKLKKMKLPDTTAAIVDWKIDLKECKKRCLENCNCTALANTITGDGRTGCVIWTVELEDLRNYATDGQDLYVKLAAIDIGEEKIINKKNIISLIVGVSVVLLVCFIMFCYWKRKQMRATTIGSPIVNQATNQDLQLNEIEISSRRHLFGDTETEDLDLPLMAYEVIAMATDNFSDSNMLGQGGFGIVYKGRLLDGQEIAVKRLSKMSHQGTTEFKNEVTLISKLQHINLVRLLGCCIDTNEKMLIYEYLENLSLDTYLFDKTKSTKLNWQQRFDITNGIARGLLYLHQDSRFRIIHRDLKASNVLLDKDMTPKISDFGMARIFGRDETEANTMKVVGTYGYMSPEYAMDGIFSVKSDTFSFGVLILEIVSGKRNRGFYNSDHDSNLLGYVWRKWEEGKGLEIVDSSLIDSLSSSPSSFRPEEALRFIQIGLLCVQEYAKDRPTMPSVVLMLGSETAAIPQPKPPGFCVERSHLEADLSSSQQLDDESYTVNQITVSVIKAR